MDRLNPLYKRAMTALVGHCSEVPAVKKLVDQKIGEVTTPILRKESFSEETRREAAHLVAEMGFPEGDTEFHVVMQACHDFHIVLDEVKELESQMFHVEAPPETALTPKPDPIQENQSILHHMARPTEDVIKVAKVFAPNAVRAVIPLTPERLVLHNLTRRFVLEFSRQGELSDELVQVVEPLARRFVEEKSSFIAEVEQVRSECERGALIYLETGKKEGLDREFIASIDKLKEQALAVRNEGLSEEEIHQAIAMRAADLVVEEYVKDAVNGYDMKKTPELENYRAIPPQIKADRRTFMTNGGVASGKSSSLEQQKERARQEGVDWRDVVVVNRDAFKPMLLKQDEVKPEYQHFFASFAEDEAFLLRDAVMQEYRSRLEEDSAPHLYVDQVWPNADMMLMAGDPTGRGLDITVVQTPVEESFSMARHRSQETGYHAVTKGLLGTHGGVPKRLLESLAKAKAAGKTNIRLKVVANVARGVITPVVDIDFQAREGQIRDRERLVAFFQKTDINPNAKRFGEIYQVRSEPVVFEHMIGELTRDINLTA